MHLIFFLDHTIFSLSYSIVKASSPDDAPKTVLFLLLLNVIKNVCAVIFRYSLH